MIRKSCVSQRKTAFGKTHKTASSTIHYVLLWYGLVKNILISRAMPWGTCAPRRKIAFAKTRKAASSTVQNILLRYGLANGAEFLLPWDSNILGSQFSHRMLTTFTVEQMDKANQTKIPWHRTLRKSPGSYDISCFHSKWNNTAMRCDYA